MVKLNPIYNPLFLDDEKMIILITGGRGCESPHQQIMMADLTIREMKDIRIGEFVMGDDGTPRKVLDKHSGISPLYKVHQSSAEDYVVNNAHILCLRKDYCSMNTGRYNGYQEFHDMNVVDFMYSTRRFREHFHGYKVGSIPYPEQTVKIEPYLLGLWLGDGTSIYPQITTPEEEIVNYLSDYAHSNNMNLTINGVRGKASVYRLGRGTNNKNPFLDHLREYDLIDNKHIPQEYISNSEQVRLELLAGLLDTDGCMERNGYEIIQKREGLARQIKYIADTLGFRTSLSTKRVKLNGKECGVFYRVFINGDTWKIPCKVSRKRVIRENVHKNKDWRRSLLSVEPIGIGEWCGITIDGNHRYLHSDGTVTHNSGKSFAAGTFIERLTFEYNKEMQIAHNILYARYTMVSAGMSVIPEFEEKIDMDGTESYFRKTKTDVVNKMTSSRVMFRGIQTSSGNQTAKLKSIKGLTTFVCDEAEEWTSYDDFERIMLSIRTKGLRNRIIIIMNPADSNHFVYEHFIKDTHRLVDYDGVPVQISTHPNVLHIHTSYLDNLEHLSEEFLDAARQMKEMDPDRYAHVFMGRWDDVAEGAIFKKWGIVEEFPAYCKKVARGCDFGYTNDVTAIVRCGVVDNRLYLDELCYRTHMKSSDLIAEFRREENAGDDGFVYAESADPRLIDEIALGGVIIYPVDKGPGSIMAGINHMLSMEIFVTKRSIHLQEELRNYVWARDRYGKYLNLPDMNTGYDHLMDASRYYCLAVLLGKVKKPTTLTKEELGIL